MGDAEEIPWTVTQVRALLTEGGEEKLWEFTAARGPKVGRPGDGLAGEIRLETDNPDLVKLLRDVGQFRLNFDI